MIMIHEQWRANEGNEWFIPQTELDANDRGHIEILVEFLSEKYLKHIAEMGVLVFTRHNIDMNDSADIVLQDKSEFVFYDFSMSDDDTDPFIAKPQCRYDKFQQIIINELPALTKHLSSCHRRMKNKGGEFYIPTYSFEHPKYCVDVPDGYVDVPLKIVSRPTDCDIPETCYIVLTRKPSRPFQSSTTQWHFKVEEHGTMPTEETELIHLPICPNPWIPYYETHKCVQRKNDD